MGNSNLVVLIEGDSEACKYFLSLPEHIRNRLNENCENISNLDDLRARAAQFMSGSE